MKNAAALAVIEVVEIVVLADVDVEVDEIVGVVVVVLADVDVEVDEIIGVVVVALADVDVEVDEIIEVIVVVLVLIKAVKTMALVDVEPAVLQLKINIKILK